MAPNPPGTGMRISVADTLARLSMSETMQDYILNRRELWATFGKMNSHLNRKILMKRMEAAQLSPESKLMIFFLFAVNRNRDSVLRAMEAMDPMVQSEPWFKPVRNFITTHLTQYVSDVARSKKFPAAMIPT